jgi:hypothetical protein
MKKKLIALFPFVAGILPNLKLDGKEKLELSEEDMGKLDKESGTEKFAESFMAAYNKYMVVDEKEAKKAFEGFMAEYNKDGIAVEGAPKGGSEESPEGDEVPKAEENDQISMINQLVKAGQELLAENKENKRQLDALKKDPEPDEPETIPSGSQKAKSVKHSKTHLFASGQAYDALDRPWNQRVVDSLESGAPMRGATVWDKVNIDKLNSDLGAYARRNSSEIMSMILDGYDIPAHWNIVTNVQDQYVFTSIATGEVTQAFKKSWLPKNKQRFVPVVNKVFDKQIDITWDSSELKSIEKSWLNMFFNEGSTPYKMSFARYLLSEIMKKARKEDKINMFKGVYFDPENLPDGTAGSFMNAMDGFLKLVSDHRNVDYKAHNLDPITAINAYDVIQDWVENDIPLDIRNMPGLVLGVGNDVLRWYKEGHKSKYGTNNDYSELGDHVYEFDNIKFVKHPQMEGTGFIYLTTEDNNGIMVDVPGEESLLEIEKDKRVINAFADYKHGVYFKAFGAKVDPNAELDYEDQIFFSNNVELLNTTYVPVVSNDATPSVADHHALVIGANNTSATNITKIDDVVEGQTYYLRGNASSNVSTVKNNTDIILSDGDFALNDGNEIVLIGLSGGKVIEYSRKVAGTVPEPTKVELAADATTANAEDGNWFITQANTGGTAFTNIQNAVAGEIYTLEGGSGTNSTTVANSGNFLLTGAFSAGVGNFLKVKYNGAKFVEIERG